MTDSTDTTRWAQRASAAVAALAVIIGLVVAGPAAAQPRIEPATPSSDSREPSTDDTTLDPARVSSGLGVEETAVAANFNAGYLISDYAFFNRTAMSEAEIQAFLEDMLPGPCTTAYCLAEYRMTTIDKTPSPRCESGYTGAANESAARIIYKVQQSCGISAKVILVTLQKEQSLITRTGPSALTLDRAMGFYCPDDPTRPGWCDPRYAGLQNQVYNAAAQFQWYRLYPNNYNFQIGWEDIRYHPTRTACGTKRVNIVNQATAGLYNYTPYTPDGPALANLYGLGVPDTCSSYGNRNFWRLYTDWFGSPTTLVPSGVETERLAGSDRWATAARISSETYPSGASTVYIAVGTNFADGLAAAPAAAIAGAPLLLVSTSTVPTATATELQRLNPTTIRIVGGTGVVSETVRTRLQALVPGAQITRYAGANRYATAEEIARGAFPEGATTVFLATGAGFADALAASAAAGSLGSPVLLMPPGATAVPPSTAALIETLGATRVIIAGGTGVVSAGVATSAAGIPGVTEVVRLGGADRYATAAAINDFAFPTAELGFIASGRDFPDALASAAAAGALDAPLHLSNGVCTYTPSLQHLVDTGVSRVAFAGGSGVLRSTVTEFLTCG